ncbi:MAG TPA: histidinol-phosphate transaminase [Oligoflexia bacterium]|nr:histidinol-phosphate transaminase [Oligoflexia bacterium]
MEKLTFHIPQHIQDLRAYKAGKSLESLTDKRGLTKFAKLASNENPLGPSPKAIAAAKKCLDQVHLYPDPAAYALRQALAKHLAIDSHQLICGSGVDSLLAYIFMAFSEKNEVILTSKGSFIGTYVNAKKLGRTLKTIGLNNWAYDLDAIAQAITDNTRIIYLANPNNPTGSMITKTDLQKFLAAVPKNILVILDEAYYEYACHHKTYPNGIELLGDYSNLIVTRTFSKAYGLAGARIGYAIADEAIIDTLNKVKLPFEPSRMGQHMAMAALEDTDFLSRTQKLNREGLDYFYQSFIELGLTFVPNTGSNAIMLYFKDAQTAQHFYHACFDQGLILRPLGAFGFDHGIRINTGTQEQNHFALDVMKKVLGLYAKELL